MVEYILFGVYILLGPAAWFFFGLAMVKGRQRMMLLEAPTDPLPQPPPRVTILIPAKDEGERIRACIESCLEQDYPDFRVIAVDDRSVDQTGTVMDALSRAHHLLSVLHIAPGSLPAGWTGKCNALFNAVRSAQGEWLLFVDSDVVLQRDALRRAVAMATERNVDVLSLLPRLESHTFWESLLVPLAGAAVSTMYLVALTNNDHLPGVAFANGQFLLFRRSVYDAIGGHQAVRDRFCEDVEFARLLKPLGKRIRISWGAHLAAVRMYSSIGSIFRGWGRNFYAGSLGRPWRILTGMFFVIACSLSVYPALAWSAWRWAHPVNAYGALGWSLAAGLHFVFLTGCLAMMYSWSGNPKRNCLFFPLGGVMLLGIFQRSLRSCLTGKVEWRGTRYTHRMDPALLKNLPPGAPATSSKT